MAYAYDSESSKRFLQSYLYSEKQDYFVSTAYRRSSSALNPDGWYYETLAWKIGAESERGDMVYQSGDATYPQAAIGQHCAALRALAEEKE